MDCEQINRLLDNYMDDAISTQDLQALEAHCRNCAMCRAQYEATREMKRALHDMAPEVEVPLKAQMKWQSAILAEAKQRKPKRITRTIAAAAAVAVVALGVTFALNRRPPEREDLQVMAIEADGEIEAEAMDALMSDAAEAAVPTREISMSVENLDATCAYIQDLISEYEGDVEIQRYEQDNAQSANLYIQLPAENADEFLTAASHYDLSGEMNAEAPDVQAEDRVSLLLVLREE